MEKGNKKECVYMYKIKARPQVRPQERCDNRGHAGGEVWPQVACRISPPLPPSASVYRFLDLSKLSYLPPLLLRVCVCGKGHSFLQYTEIFFDQDFYNAHSGSTSAGSNADIGLLQSTYD